MSQPHRSRAGSRDLPGGLPVLSPGRMLRHWERLCREIGERRAGSAGEQAAADYVAEQWRQAGLQNVHTESFPCTSVVRSHAEIGIGSGRSFQSVPARVLAGSPPTPKGRPVSGPLVWVEMPEQAERLIGPSLRRRIVALFGPLPTSAKLHRRLVECRPAAVIHVDDRLPFEWVKDDGVYPTWVRRYGMPPSVTIPYRLAWELRKQGAKQARVRIDVELKIALSQNVVGEVPGRRPDLPLVLLGAHHDTQCHNVGADDNASGVVALLELATLFAHSQPERAIRLVSFGAEEQLSVGSARYVSEHRRELTAVGVMLNLDSVASVMGHCVVIRAGTKQFGKWLLSRLARSGLDAAEKQAPMPFADHFPFSVFGVPSATLYRPNMDSGLRWQHHSAQDTLDNASIDELSRVVRAVAAAVRDLAKEKTWPFPRGLAVEQRAETRRLARELFDLPTGSRRAR